MRTLPITGYLDRFSRRPGEAFAVHVGMATPGPYRAHLVRVASGDPNPDGPGLRLDDRTDLLDHHATGRHQPDPPRLARDHRARPPS